MNRNTRTIHLAVFADSPVAAEPLIHSLGNLNGDSPMPSEIRFGGRKPVAVYTFTVDTAETGGMTSHMTLDEVENIHIRVVLGLFEGRIKAAAKALGINRTTLYRKMKRYGIER